VFKATQQKEGHRANAADTGFKTTGWQTLEKEKELHLESPQEAEEMGTIVPLAKQKKEPAPESAKPTLAAPEPAKAAAVMTPANDNPISDLALAAGKLLKFPVSDASLENLMAPVIGAAKARLPGLNLAVA
jgi:hypothetical protein